MHQQHASVVMSTNQTHNGPNFVKTRQKGITNSGFSLKMEESEHVDGGHVQESVGWFAIQQSTGTLGHHHLEYQALSVTNVRHNTKTISFGDGFTHTPEIFGSIATFNGADPCELRYESKSASSASFFIEEDTCRDNEKSHTNEVVSFIAIQGGYIMAPTTLEH